MCLKLMTCGRHSPISTTFITFMTGSRAFGTTQGWAKTSRDSGFRTRILPTYEKPDFPDVPTSLIEEYEQESCKITGRGLGLWGSLI